MNGADVGSGGSETPHTGGAGGSGADGGGGGVKNMTGGAGGDAGPADSGDGKAPVAYDCIGGKVARVPADSGAFDSGAAFDPASLVFVPWTESLGTCEAGKTYCNISSIDHVADNPPTRTCDALPSTCKDTPSCACLCSHGLPCQEVNCSCKDDAQGRAIWACDQI